MPAQDDPARDPLRPGAGPWVAESPLVGEAAAEEQAPIHPWYRGHTPFVEGRELGEMYGPEPEEESGLAALETESPVRGTFDQGQASRIKPEEPEGEFVTEELLQRPSWQPLSLPQDCQSKLRSTRVAVVGGGLAGLMAARRLGQHGINVTVFEARSRVGGRVLSNTTFSNGRITEEGAELIGSFHLTWLELAREYGLAVVSRMDNDLYERAGLDVQLMLDKKLTVDEIHKLDKEMETRVLEPIARDAGQIRDPSQPWLEPWLEQFDKMSVADALVHRYGVKRSERLWKMIEFKLVNDEVAPLDEMNFLGLLCKVKAGQGVRFRSDDTGDLKERLMRVLMRYWNELEIFRCADGCQTLATKMADEIRTKYGAELRPSTAVTHINLSELGVALGVKKVKSNGEFADDKPPVFIPGGYGYVILAIPPSVWAGVKITVDGKDAHPKDKIGLMGMNPAVKFFSDVKERFWIKDKAAPNGGSSTLGQVWEGTDNQTRVEVKIPDPRGRPLAVKQGIVLSVFAGPILAGPRVPTRDEFKKELRRLYSGYTDDKLNKEPLLSNWPRVPFIMTGYASPTRGQIFTIGRELNKPWHERMFFAGEHTQMDFFGYMEGALRSGDRAAHALISKACGLLNGPVPASSKLPVITASTVPVRENTAFEYEAPLGEYSSTDSPGEAESPLTYQELFAEGPEEEWEPRAAALVAESPLVGALEDGRSRFDGYQSEEVEAAYNLEGEEESGAEEVREDELQLLLEQPLEERFDPSSIPSDVADALRKKDWPLALKLAIQAGWRDENDLTNLVFFARHQELPSEKLDPTGPNFKQLSAEWTKILNDEVWKAIELSAENTDLVVSGEEVADHHRRFFRGKSGKRLKNLVEDAAREVDLNPGLLGTIMMAETRRPQSYLSSERVSSYHIGADDFYEGRAAIKARVPAYARVKWDQNQTPSEHLNDAKTNRRIVKTILFDSGPDAVLATAVYLKFREVRLREVAAEMKGDFDNLPLATRFALTRMAMAAGTAGATPFLKDALKGADIFVRRAIPVRAYQTQRNATVRTAQAMHLSDWIFGIPVPAAAAQPELETFEGFNEEFEEFYGFDADSSSLEPGHHELDGRVPPEGELFHGLAVEEAFNEERFADLEDELSLEPYESETRDLLPEEETTEGLTKKLTLLSLLPHTVEASGTDVSLTPSVMDPGIYDGPEKYKIAPKLQECLMGVMNKREFSHIKVTLVDLTKDTTKPEFAGFNHKSQVFAASVPKIAAMLAAFQLRHDLRASLKQKGSKTLDELFALVRDDWVATQAATEGKATPLTFGVSLKGKLVLVQGEKIPLSEPKAPQLESVFAGVKVGSPVTIEFQSTGESKDQLKAIIDDFNKTKKGAKEKLDALGFLERMRIMIGGLVPASNYATSTIVRDVGFLYIASALIQSGLYDTNRKGGLWLGADYWGSKWRGPLGGGVAQSATAGSLAAFMTLLAQNRLVSPQASTETGALMKKEPNPTHPGIVSWFKEGLKGLKDGGTLNLVLSKLGAHSGVDDCTLIEREVNLGDSKKVLRYVAVGLRARSPKELKSLILELDKCILANNGLTPAQGGHS